MRRSLRALLALGILGCTAQCARNRSTTPAAANTATPTHAAVATPAAPTLPLDPRWLTIVRTIAEGYESWGRVDDQYRFAPADCLLLYPPSARLSEPGSHTAHGRKLYFLYALDPVAYGFPPTSALASSVRATPIPRVRQAVVKEAFVPTRLAVDANTRFPLANAPSIGMFQPAIHDGAAWGPGERAGLFMMFQVEGDQQGTDEGWVYATVAADRRTVLSAGVIENCRGCHLEATHGRLFGVTRGGTASPAR